jgi:hypothetical protein
MPLPAVIPCKYTESVEPAVIATGFVKKIGAANEVFVLPALVPATVSTSVQPALLAVNPA